MATEAQVLANRRNAGKSTGPRTAESKAAVAQNAVKHGLSARLDVIKGEDQAEFDLQREAMLGELAPVGAVESMLAERVVGLSWRLKRVERIQNEVFDAMLADRNSPLAKLVQSLQPKAAGRPEDDPEGDLALGRVVLKDFSNSRVLDRLLMYERRVEHSLYKTMAELQRLRLVRELDGPAEEVSSVKCQVSSREGQASTLQTSNFTPNTSGQTDELCKTKPIPPGPNEGQVPCDKGVRKNSAQNGLGKNKANFPGRDVRRPAAGVSLGKRDGAPLRGISCFG